MNDDGWGFGVFAGLLALLFAVLLCVSECESKYIRDELKHHEEKQRVCPMCEGEGVVTLPEVEEK